MPLKGGEEPFAHEHALATCPAGEWRLDWLLGRGLAPSRLARGRTHSITTRPFPISLTSLGLAIQFVFDAAIVVIAVVPIRRLLIRLAILGVGIGIDLLAVLLLLL